MHHIDPSPGQQFLIADFQGLYEQRIALNTTTINEINIFLLIVSAFAVGMGFLVDIELIDESGLLLIAGTASTVLGVIGYALFYRTVNARIQITTYIRLMNRIRRYFVDTDPTIMAYAPPYIHDDAPSFLQISQDTSRLASILSNTFSLMVVTSALFACSAISFTRGLSWTDWLLSLVGMVVLLGVGFLMLRKQDLMLREAESNALEKSVNFPGQSSPHSSGTE